MVSVSSLVYVKKRLFQIFVLRVLRNLSEILVWFFMILGIFLSSFLQFNATLNIK